MLRSAPLATLVRAHDDDFVDGELGSEYAARITFMYEHARPLDSPIDAPFAERLAPLDALRACERRRRRQCAKRPKIDATVPPMSIAPITTTNDDKPRCNVKCDVALECNAELKLSAEPKTTIELKTGGVSDNDDDDYDEERLLALQRELARTPAVGRARALLRFADDTLVIADDIDAPSHSEPCAPKMTSTMTSTTKSRETRALISGSKRYRTPDDDELRAARATLLRSCVRVYRALTVREAVTNDAFAVCFACNVPLADHVAAGGDLVRATPRCADHRAHDAACQLVRVGACVECMASTLATAWRRSSLTSVACPWCRAPLCEDDLERVVVVDDDM